MRGLAKYPSGLETISTPFRIPLVSASCRPLEARLGVSEGVVWAGAAAGAGVAAGAVAAGVAAGAAVGVEVVAGVVVVGAAAGVLFAGAVVVVFAVDFVVFAGAFFVVVVFLVCAKAMLVHVSADRATRAIMREYFMVIVKKGKKVMD